MGSIIQVGSSVNFIWAPFSLKLSSPINLHSGTKNINFKLLLSYPYNYRHNIIYFLRPVTCTTFKRGLSWISTYTCTYIHVHYSLIINKLFVRSHTGVWGTVAAAMRWLTPPPFYPSPWRGQRSTPWPPLPYPPSSVPLWQSIGSNIINSTKCRIARSYYKVWMCSIARGITSFFFFYLSSLLCNLNGCL